MAELMKLNVEFRDKLGKGPNRRLRMENKVPGIYYDSEGHNIPVKMNLVPLQKAYAALGNSKVFEMIIEQQGETHHHPALFWRVRHEPVKGLPEHVDFFGVDLTKDIKIAVRFELVGTAKGLKSGGMVELGRDSIEVVCKPMDIPDAIVIDVTDLDVSDSIHIQDVVFPEGVIPVIEENYAVVSVIEPREEEAAPAETETAEGETPAAEDAAE